MRTSSTPRSCKQLFQMIKKGTIRFDHPMQRRSDQWDLEQKSDFIASIIEGYPIPAIYAIKIDGVYQVLQGKQRLTTLYEYMNDELDLIDYMDEVYVESEETHYDIDGRTFSETYDAVQQEVLTSTLTVYAVEEATEEQIGKIMFKLNTSAPLTRQQLLKGKIGNAAAEAINKTLEHPFIRQCVHFNPAQYKANQDEVTIIQAMMLLNNDHDVHSFGAPAIVQYTLETHNKGDLLFAQLVEIQNICDYLQDCTNQKDKKLLKKQHLPFIFYAAKQALDQNAHPETFQDWMNEFKLALVNQSELPTNYNDYTGAGSIKWPKVQGRKREVMKHFEDYLKNLKTVDMDLTRSMQVSGIL